MSDLLTVILAAGKGTRMKSEKNKVLHKVAGQEMVNQVIDIVDQLSKKIVCIVGYQAEQVKKQIKNKKVNFRYQKKQLGTAHAVMQADQDIINHQGDVLIIYADVPLIKEETVNKLYDYHHKNNSDITVLTTLLDDPSGYGRIIKDNNDQIKKIVEEKDTSSEEKKVNEINSGIMIIDSKMLNKALTNINNDNAQNEYYLTDIVKLIKEEKGKALSFILDNSSEVIGINDRSSLARAEKIMRNRINEKHLKEGVTIIDPETTYIDQNVKIGPDTIIYPFTYIEGNTKIGKNNTIMPHNHIVDCTIGDNNKIKDSNLIKRSTIKDNCNIGPFAHIRPNCLIKDNVKIGDYVETKKAIIGKKTKVPHLSYVGDAEIGENTNIGAGAIFANYDGKNKHKTQIGNNVFIGSNTTLVAPLKVGSDGKTGAGAVVTKDVKENTTVIGVPAREYKKGCDD